MNDEPLRTVEHGPESGNRSGCVSQRSGKQVVEDAEAEKPARDAEVTLHGVEVAATVAATDRDPGDEVVQHVLVQDDEPGSLVQRIDDPAVRVGVVSDVVERDVRRGRALSGLRDTTSIRSRSAGSSSSE